MKKKPKKQRAKARKNHSISSTNSVSTSLIEAIMKMKDSHRPRHQLGDEADLFAMSSFPAKSSAALTLAPVTRSTGVPSSTSHTSPAPSSNFITRSLARLRRWFKRIFGLKAK